MITDQERQSERVRERERETTTNKGGDASENVPLVFQSVMSASEGCMCMCVSSTLTRG